MQIAITKYVCWPYEWLMDAKVKFAKEVTEEDQFKKLASK